MDVDELLNLTHGLRLNPGAREYLKSIKEKHNNPDKRSESGQPNRTRGEQEPVTTDAPGTLHLCESWLRYDVLGRGRTDEVMVLWDVDMVQPIYYDFMEEVSATGKRPFDVLRAIPIKDRWFGMSFYELLSNEHNFVDLQKTRLNHRNGRNSVVKFMRQNSVAEIAAGWKFDIDLPHVWNQTDGDQAKGPPLSYVELPKIDEGIWEMLRDARQQATLMSGTITPADAAAQGLNESKTLGQTSRATSTARPWRPRPTSCLESSTARR
jgi:hypothetical protein